MANKTFQNFINWFAGTYQGPKPVTLLDENGNPFDSGNPLPVGATVTPAANQRVNAQAGDFVDLLTLLTLSGTPTDANTVNSFMGRLTKIRDLLLTAQINTGTPTGSVVSVGTGSTAVVTPGANAKLLILTNDSANTIYLNISGGAAALNAGIRLNANGGSILFDRYVPSAAITAISSIAASNLLVEVG